MIAAARALLGVAVLIAACAPAPSVATPAALATAAARAAPAPTATPMASPAAAVAVAPVPARARVLHSVGGIEFQVIESPAELYVEPQVADADADRVGEQVAADVRDVERELGLPFARRPVIYVFATTTGYAAGMAAVFGYSGATALWIADKSVSFFEPPLRIIGVNWEAVRDRLPLASIRHELTHDLTLDACAPRCDLVPAWLNEGQARLAEALIPGSEWRLARVRFEAASMAATGTLIPLHELVAQSSWNLLVSWAGYYKYQQAARTVELLREDVGGPAPIARVYEHIRQGRTVAQAYAALTGRSLDEFVAGLPARIAAVAPGPGIAPIDSVSGASGTSYLLHGFAPGSAVAVTVGGPRGPVSSTVTVSPFGASIDSLAPDLPRGRYVVTGASGDARVTATLVKQTRGGPTRDPE